MRRLEIWDEGKCTYEITFLEERYEFLVVCTIGIRVRTEIRCGIKVTQCRLVLFEPHVQNLMRHGRVSHRSERQHWRPSLGMPISIDPRQLAWMIAIGEQRKEENTT